MRGLASGRGAVSVGAMNPNEAYADLVARLQRVHLLASVSELLGWDEQVNLPPDSADQRAEQRAVLAEAEHAAREAELQDQQFRRYVQEAAGSQGSADQLARLADLRDRGVITADEFDREKAKILA